MKKLASLLTDLCPPMVNTILYSLWFDPTGIEPESTASVTDSSIHSTTFATFRRHEQRKKMIVTSS